MNHTITHIEIPAPDLVTAAEFYSKVFRWEIIPVESGYSFFMIPGIDSGGGLDASLKPAQEKCGVQITIDVEDIEEKLKEIETSGGKVIMGKTEIAGGHGFYAVFCDPNGNYMQLHSR